MTISAGEVDGVPAFWWQEPNGASPAGACTAGLMFRVGTADETLATRGITHLLEHLALYPLFIDAGKHVNGETGPLVTTFLTRGDADEVTEFLTAVCASLRDLPGDRVEKEKQVLRAERAGRELSMTSLLWRHRYGARGFGLTSFPELGLDRVGQGDLGAWAERGFTRGNAALWLTGGEPPARLRLDLAEGGRAAVPDMPATVRAVPGYFNASVPGPGVCGLVERSTAAQVCTSVLADRLIAELRHDQGIAYSPTAQYSVRDGRHAHIIASADGTEESMSVLTAEFLRLLSRLRDQPPDAGEVRAAAKRIGRRWESPTAADAQAQARQAAQNALLGLPNGNPDEWKRKLAEVSPDDVRRVAEEAFGGGDFVLPRKQKPFIAGIPRIPWSGAVPVTGRAAASADAPFESDRLIIGPEGVSIRSGEQSLTVRFAECAALLVRPDGARGLIGLDAIEVPVEPTIWRLKADEISRIDAAVPRDRHVRTPYRAPEKIPRPRTRPWMRLAGRLAESASLAAVVFLAVVVGVPLLVARFSEQAGFLLVPCLAVVAIGALRARKPLRALLGRAIMRRAGAGR